jgi:hypothetical protein
MPLTPAVRNAIQRIHPEASKPKSASNYYYTYRKLWKLLKNRQEPSDLDLADLQWVADSADQLVPEFRRILDHEPVKKLSELNSMCSATKMCLKHFMGEEKAKRTEEFKEMQAIQHAVGQHRHHDAGRGADRHPADMPLLQDLRDNFRVLDILFQEPQRSRLVSKPAHVRNKLAMVHFLYAFLSLNADVMSPRGKEIHQLQISTDPSQNRLDPITWDVTLVDHKTQKAYGTRSIQTTPGFKEAMARNFSVREGEDARSRTCPWSDSQIRQAFSSHYVIPGTSKPNFQQARTILMSAYIKDVCQHTPNEMSTFNMHSGVGIRNMMHWYNSTAGQAGGDGYAQRLARGQPPRDETEIQQLARSFFSSLFMD